MKHATILGAIAGDVIGSIYEFHPTKNPHFPLLNPKMEITDDSIMTIAVAQWMMEDPCLSPEGLVSIMQRWGRKYRYPMGSYGGRFAQWLDSDNPQPYGSWGNGSAMRVAACGFAAHTLEEALQASKASAMVTHNHPEGIKGAQAVACAIFMAAHGADKHTIRGYITDRFGYDLSATCDEIRQSYSFDGSCQGTVPQSLIAFFDSKDYEDAIRLTVSLGGDADTMGAITGAVAIAYYKEMPDAVYDFVMARIPTDLKQVVEAFESKFTPKPAMCCGVTPENITSLKPHEVFVFGSNLAGQHLGGAARAAVKYFGAKMGVGVGLQGQAYAIPTMQGGVETIRPYVDQFIDFARSTPNRQFLVTKIGCGIAGFQVEEIAPLFAEALYLPNVSLPQEFIDLLRPHPAYTPDEMKALKMWKLGLGDMGKAVNGQDPMPSKEVIATPDRFHNRQPMPAEYVTIPLHFAISGQAIRMVERGHIPEAMEDHWYMYCHHNTIYYHRSWTGLCIFTARYEIRGGNSVITSLRINRNREQYAGTDDAKDVALFLALLCDEFGGDSSSFWDEVLS